MKKFVSNVVLTGAPPRRALGLKTPEAIAAIRTLCSASPCADFTLQGQRGSALSVRSVVALRRSLTVTRTDSRPGRGNSRPIQNSCVCVCVCVYTHTQNSWPGKTPSRHFLPEGNAGRVRPPDRVLPMSTYVLLQVYNPYKGMSRAGEVGRLIVGLEGNNPA